MDKILKIILFLVVVIGLLIYFAGRTPNIFQGRLPSGTSLFRGISLLNQTSTPGPPGFSLPPWSPAFGGGATFKSPLGEIFSGYYSNTLPDYLIPQGFTRSQLSPYFKRIKISSVTGSSFFGGNSQAQLSSSLASGERVNITGWHLKSNRGDILIPRAVNIYDPIGLNNEEEIIISGNSSLHIYGNTSPIARNLRLNKCTGFLNNNYNFNPALPNNCPALFSRQEIVNLAGFCQSYLLSLGACRLPDTAFANSLPANNEGNACRAFLNKLNPRICYDQHFGDFDFLSNEWVIWANQNTLDPQHDQVQLLDRQGLLVDQYTY